MDERDQYLPDDRLEGAVPEGLSAQSRDEATSGTGEAPEGLEFPPDQTDETLSDDAAAYDLREAQDRRRRARRSSGGGARRRRRAPREAEDGFSYEDASDGSGFDESGLDEHAGRDAFSRENTRARRERARQADGKRKRRPRRRQPIIRGAINRWFVRLGDVRDNKSFDVGASEYEASQTTSDYLLNTVGAAAWGALFPILSIIATQLAGVEQAGLFSMAFTVATLMLYVGNYGVRTFQVSDIDEAESFSSYQVHRFITSAAMLLICFVWCNLKGYDAEMTTIMWGAFIFRMIDALADVYEARLQQMDKLYLAGVSVAVRSVIGIIVFTLALLITKSLSIASMGMAVSSVACLLVLTVPLAFLETPKSRSFDAGELAELFVECFPSFAALFLFGLIEAMPKFAMEGVLPYEDQVFFNAIYFPAQMILMVVGFVYKPQLVTIANIWNDRGKRHRFDLIVIAMMGTCVVVTIGALIIYATVGIWLNGLMYGVDFEPFRLAQYLMVAAGGFSAAIDFLYQVVTVLRRQAQATLTYLAAFAVVAVASMVLVRTQGFMGAVYSYLIVMVILFIMLGVQFVLMRIQER